MRHKHSYCVTFPDGTTETTKTTRTFTHAIARMVDGEWGAISWTAAANTMKVAARETTMRPVGWTDHGGRTWGAVKVVAVEAA